MNTTEPSEGHRRAGVAARLGLVALAVLEVVALACASPLLMQCAGIILDPKGGDAGIGAAFIIVCAIGASAVVAAIGTVAAIWVPGPGGRGLRIFAVAVPALVIAASLGLIFFTALRSFLR